MSEPPTLQKNYELINTVKGLLTVTEVPSVNVPVPDQTGFIYDGTEKTFMTVDADAGYTAVTGSTLKAKDAGTYTVTLSLKDANGTQWSDGTTEDKTYTFRIEKASLVIAVNDKNAVVGDLYAPAFTSHDYSFLASPVSTDSDKITVTLNYIDPNLVKAGTYGIDASVTGDAAKNYTVTIVKGTLTVAPRLITIPVPEDTNFVYDGKLHEFIAEGVGYEIASGSAEGTDAGIYSVTLALSDTVNTRWSDGTVENKTYTFKIVKAPLIVLASNKTVGAGSTAPDLSRAVKDTDYKFLTAPCEGDDIVITLSYEKTPDMSKAGTYTIKAAVSGADAENYTITAVDGTLTVNPAALPGSVTLPIPETTSYLYDGTEKNFMTVASDAGYTAVTGSTLKARDAGTYTVTLSLKDTNATQWSDGTTEDKTYTFRIEKAPLIVLASNKTVGAGSTAPDLSKAVKDTDYKFLTAPCEGDDIVITLSYEKTPDMSKAGTYTIKAAVSGADAENYTVTAVDGTLTVNPAALPGSVTLPIPETTSYLYDGTEKTFMTVASDAGYTAVTGSTLKARNAGIYTVTLSLKDANATQWSDGTTEDKTYTFRIEKAPLTVQAGNKTVTVGDPAPDLTKAEKVKDYKFLIAPVEGDDIVVTLNYMSTPDMSKASTYTIKAVVSGADAKNYSITVVDGTLTVNSEAIPESVSVILGGSVTLKGFPANSTFEPVFTFTLSENGKVIDTQTVTRSGDYNFSDIVYTEAGVHTYTVKETAEDLAGVTYDSKTYTVTVTVENQAGKLAAEISGSSTSGTDLNFVNSYEAAAADIRFSVVKTLNGAAYAANMFTFTLTAEDGTSETVKNAEDGKISFSNLTFDKAGEYRYTIKEEKAAEAGSSAESKVYSITVTVTDNGSGILMTDITGTADSGEDMNFIFNSEELVISEAESPMTGIGSDIMMIVIPVIIAGYVFIFFAIYNVKKKKRAYR